jgi:DNA-directed RNA polymerase subunit RPC12/RpoP
MSSTMASLSSASFGSRNTTQDTEKTNTDTTFANPSISKEWYERKEEIGHAIPTTPVFTASHVRPEAFISECERCKSLIYTKPTEAFHCGYCGSRVLLKIRTQRTTVHKADVG